jgi:hypothetical protein
MIGLDALAFPHIFDPIVAYALYDSLLKLRCVPLSLKVTVDTQLFHHVCILFIEDRIVLRSALGGQHLPLDLRVASWLQNEETWNCRWFLKFIRSAHNQSSAPHPQVDWNWLPEDFTCHVQDLEMNEDGTFITDPRDTVAARHLAALHLAQAALSRTRYLDVSHHPAAYRVIMPFILGKGATCAASHDVPNPEIIRDHAVPSKLGEINPFIFVHRVTPETAMDEFAAAVASPSVSRLVTNLAPSMTVELWGTYEGGRPRTPVVLENIVIIIHPSDEGHRTDYPPFYGFPGVLNTQLNFFHRRGKDRQVPRSGSSGMSRDFLDGPEIISGSYRKSPDRRRSVPRRICL